MTTGEFIGEQTDMGDRPWFKVWAREALASPDLNSLSDHEERIWWRLMMLGSIQEPRWHVRMEAEALARMCATTKPKLQRALKTMEGLGMVSLEADGIRLPNAPKYQETPEAQRKRRQREREKGRDDDRDTPRDMSREMSRDCPTESHDRGQRTEDRDKDLCAADAAKPAKRITKAFRDKMREEFPGLDEPEEFDKATNHVSYDKAKDKQRYYRNWLRRADEWRREREGRRPKPKGGYDGEIIWNFPETYALRDAQ